MTASRDELDQAELTRLLAESGIQIASFADARYSMRLERKAGALWLIIDGMVMQPVPDDFIARLTALCQETERPRAIVDLRRCTYLCSSALGVLSVMFQASAAVGGRVLLLGANEKVLKMIRLVGLDGLFDIVADETAALRLWHGLELVRRGLDPRFAPAAAPRPKRR